MSIPQIKTKFGINIGVTVFVKSPDLSDYQTTYLSADETAAQTTLSVISSSNFSGNEYVLLGNFGEEKAEIRKIASIGSGSIVTDATTFAHPRGTKITFIPYNQITISRSDDSGATYTALTASNIQADNDWTITQRTADASTDMYKVRFYNSTTTLYSSYSDAVVASGYAYNAVYSIKNRALLQLGETLNEDITDSFLNEALWEARREIENDKQITKLPFRKKLNSAFYKIIPGQFKVALPTDLKEPYSNKNISKIRIGRDGQEICYQPTNDFWQNYKDIAYTVLDGAVVTADVTITLENSGDFDSSGSIDVASPSISGTIDSVAYTGNTLSTNILTGVTGIVASGHASGVYVWQGADFGEPYTYTVEYTGGVSYILFNCPFEEDLAGENIYIDYYNSLPVYNSDADILDEPEIDMFVDYLKWKIKSWKANGTLLPTQDADFITWTGKKSNFITKLYSGDVIHFYPGK